MNEDVIQQLKDKISKLPLPHEVRQDLYDDVLYLECSPFDHALYDLTVKEERRQELEFMEHELKMMNLAREIHG